MIQDADCSRSFPRCLINANKLRLRGDCDRIALIGNQMGTLKRICDERQEWVCKQRRCDSNWLSLRVRPARRQVPSEELASVGSRCHLKTEHILSSLVLITFIPPTQNLELISSLLGLCLLVRWGREARTPWVNALLLPLPAVWAEGGGWSVRRWDARSWWASGRGSDSLARRRRCG